MKLKIFLTTICAIAISLNYCAHAQNKVVPKQAVQKIREFYVAYNTAWSANISPKELDQRLDSLKMKYCSIALIVDLKGYIEYDPLINDQYTDVKHLSTLSVSQDPGKHNCYTVSYLAPTISPSNNPIVEKEVIYLTVIKGERGIVIDRVGN